MAGVGRSVSGSFVSATRSVLRVFMNSSNVAGAGSKRAVGTRVMAPLKPAVRSVPFSHSSSSTTCGAESSRRSASHFLRLGGEMACAQSLLPLHNAIATSQMVAQLSTTAEMLLQGTLTHISPDRLNLPQISIGGRASLQPIANPACSGIAIWSSRWLPLLT